MRYVFAALACAGALLVITVLALVVGISPLTFERPLVSLGVLAVLAGVWVAALRRH